jgi:membrane-associated protease RseP (regulator of RpoE activity)
MDLRRVLTSLGLLLVIACPAAGQGAAVPWEEVLGPPQGKWPPPREGLADAVDVLTLRKVTARTSIRWEEDVGKALAIARAEDRPVFVTFRCLPCRTCSEFDKTVLEGGPDLDPLFRQFVTVRLTSAKDIDLSLMPMGGYQDLDVSWWSWFLSPEGQVYGVYGGRDTASDTTRTSRASLIKAMQRVLDHHYDPRRNAWKVDPPAPDLARKGPTPVDLPGFGSWLRIGRNEEHYKAHACVHCHQVAEIMREEPIARGTFNKRRDLDVWPFPENAGIVVERDDGLLVKSVKPASPAEAAGVRKGDLIGAAGGVRLFSQADLRGVLHRGPQGAGRLALHWLRDGKVMSGELALADGWRKSDPSWRVSIAQGNIGASPGGFWPVDASRKRNLANVARDQMCVEPHFGWGGKPKGAAVDAGLKNGDLIVAVNGQSPPLHDRAWLVWFRLKFDPGDEIRLTVVDARTRQEREVKYLATAGGNPD